MKEKEKAPEAIAEEKRASLPGKDSIRRELERLSGSPVSALADGLSRIGGGRVAALLKGVAGTLLVVGGLVLLILSATKLQAAQAALDGAKRSSEKALEQAAQAEEKIAAAEREAEEIITQAYQEADAIVNEAERYRQEILSGGVEPTEAETPTGPTGTETPGENPSAPEPSGGK